jgi:hypothetical protein
MSAPPNIKVENRVEVAIVATDAMAHAIQYEIVVFISNL